MGMMGMSGMFQLPFTPGATIPSTFFRGVISTTRCFYSNDNGVTDLPLGCDKKLAPMFIVGTWLSNANCRTWLGFSRRGSFVFVVKTKPHSPPLISAPTLWFSQCVPTANFAPMCKNQQSFNRFSKSVVKPHFANICSAIFSWFPNRDEELAFSTPVVRMQGGSKERIGKGAKRSRGYA